MRWFLGGEVTRFTPQAPAARVCRERRHRDRHVCSSLTMARLLSCVVRTPHGYHTETEIVGTEAHIRVAGVPWKDRVMVYDQYGARQEIVENFPQRFAEAYLLEMVDFIDCIQKDRKPELTVYDGTKATLVTYAITDSFHSGKPVQVQY
ncbi:MAG: Gfo/Idh/MocA family oxidoreductase [Butyricicoccus sp.]